MSPRLQASFRVVGVVRSSLKNFISVVPRSFVPNMRAVVFFFFLFQIFFSSCLLSPLVVVVAHIFFFFADDE